VPFFSAQQNNNNFLGDRVMKRISVFVLITVAMIGSLIQPATATVVVTCQDLGGGVAEFSYDASDETILGVCPSNS
jgi:hypothetical protein